MAKTPETKPHAIMISVPYQGHLSPFVNLALKLASKGFKVTFVHTEHAHHCITKSIINNNHNKGNSIEELETIDIFAGARVSTGFDINYRTIPDGFPLEYDRETNLVEFWEFLLNDFHVIVDEFIGELLKSDQLSDDGSSSLVPILVADTYPGWAAKIAQKYGLVNVSFWTEPALVFAATYYSHLLKENGHFPPKDDKNHDIDYIPGVESISTIDLPSYYKQEYETPTIAQKIAFFAFDQVKKADFILVNTVHELEPHVLSSLSQTHPTYAIGPINFSKESIKSTVPKSLLPETDCSKWLDNKPSRSVLYISFGSIVHTDKHVIEEIARGLELSGVSFLWTLRNHTSNNGEVDDKGKGLIVPWCDQRAVLSHDAIGGFLTHCGWNSVLESMWFCVPMICYPMGYDQPTNKKLVVDDWKVGIDLCDGDEMILIDAEKLAEKIKKVMMMSVEKEMNREVVKVSEILHDALEDDGSSERNFNLFVGDLKDEIIRGCALTD